MILVTGVTGLVGGHLLWHLLQENYRVRAIRRTTSNLMPLHTIFSFYSPNPDEALARIDWQVADVLEPESLRNAMNGVAQVYHCAAVVSLGNGSDILLDTNVVGTRNMVQAALAAKVVKFCFVSSIAACGRATKGIEIDENSEWSEAQSRSLYSQSKYASEQEVWKGIECGLNAVIVNPGVILGVSGTDTGSSQLFAQVRKGLMFYTHGGSGYVDVRDVVTAMIQLMRSEISNNRFVLVGENCSNKEILCWMADGFGKRRPFIGIGRKTLLFIGAISELLAKMFRFKPLIDKAMARTATNREYYSSRKIIDALKFQFTPIEKCIGDVCEFLKRQ